MVESGKSEARRKSKDGRPGRKKPEEAKSAVVFAEKPLAGIGWRGRKLRGGYWSESCNARGGRKIEK